jgi:RNA polymerase sigma-70 factor (ECF subfamily)
VTPTLPISMLDSICIPTSDCTHLVTPPKSCTDHVLALAQTGDHEAFSKLYMRHKKLVISICMRMTRDFSLAEDLTQETFMQLHRKLASFRGDSTFTTWLGRMTINIVLAHLRRRLLPIVSFEDETTKQPEERFGRFWGVRDLMQAGVIDRLAIDRAIASLPPGYQRAFILHDVLGFKHSDIAATQDCTSGNSKSQLYKARRALRDALSD